MHAAILKALPVHEDGEALWRRATLTYRQALDTAALHLCALAPPSLCTEKETADLLWSWFGPTSWRTLVVDNGWTWERAEDVLYRTAVTVFC